MKPLFLILDPSRQWKVLSLLIAFYYGGISLLMYALTPSPYFSTCGVITGISTLGVYFGGFFAKKKRLLASTDQQQPNSVLVIAVALFFIIFVTVVILTSSSIPIITSLSGGDAQAVSEARADFLKSRSGWEEILVYLNALFSGFFFPYLLVKLYYIKSKRFLPLLIVFASYSILSTEKAFFFRWALPLLVLFLMLGIEGDQKHVSLAKRLLIIAVILMLLNISLAGLAGSGSLLEAFQGISLSDFFNSDFAASTSKGSALTFLLWRSLAVPLFTAIDSIKTFHEVFNNHILLGATNGTLANFFGLPRVWFEREVFAGQWGQSYDGTNSANAVFFIEAYINFGWAGVIVFSLLVGYLLAKMGNSRDIGIVTLTPLLTLSLFIGGLLGNLLGNGLLLVLLVSWLHMKDSRWNRPRQLTPRQTVQRGAS